MVEECPAEARSDWIRGDPLPSGAVILELGGVHANLREEHSCRQPR